MIGQIVEQMFQTKQDEFLWAVPSIYPQLSIIATGICDK